MIYLDYAATAPMSETAIEVYTEVARRYYGNPISLHNIGTVAAELLETSRAKIASLIGGEKEGLYFTGGGSESNQLALEALLDGQTNKGKHLITSILEHSSIYHFFRKKENEGYSVTYVPVDRFGRIDPESVRKAIRPDTVLASIHFGNGEIGTIQPIQEIGAVLRDAGVLFHSDCAQTFGKIPLNMCALPIDSITVSSPKVYGPKGVGAVYIRPQIRWQPAFPGTTHESGFRAGTVNVPGVCAFAASAQAVVDGMIEETARLEALRKDFVEAVERQAFAIAVEGHPTEHLPHVIALRPNGMEGQYMMLEMNRLGVAISTGSACLVGQSEPPRVMKALGLSDAEAKQFIRISTGEQTTSADMNAALQKIDQTLQTFFERVASS